jgi:hypothetical protein
MAKNQKRGAQALQWQTFGFVLFVVVSLAGMALGYVVQRRAHHRLGDQLTALEKKVQSLNVILDQRLIVHTRLSSAAELRQRVADLHIDLTNIVPSQRLFVPMPQYRSIAGGTPALPASPISSPTTPNRELSSFRPPLAAAAH